MKNLRVTGVILLLLFTCCPLFAFLEFGGVFSLDYYGLIDPDVFYEQARLRLSGFPEIHGRLESRWFEFYLSGVLLAQVFGEPPGGYPETGWHWTTATPLDTLLEAYVREAYLGFHVSIVDLYIGQRLVNWGKVDILSPLNVINHSDSSVLSMDNSREASLADVMVQIQVYPTDFLKIEAVYVPFFHPNIAPISEVIVREDRQEEVASWPRPKRFVADARFLNRETDPYSIWGHSVHFSVSYFSYWIDLMVSYSSFMDQNMDFDLSGIVEDISLVDGVDRHDITGTGYPEFNRVNNFGFGVSFDSGKWLLSSDFAVRLTEDPDGTDMGIKNDEVRTAFQIERVFSPQINTAFSLLHRYILDYDAEAVSDYSFYLQDYIEEIADEYLVQFPRGQMYFLLHGDKSFLHDRLNAGGNIILGPDENDALYLFFRLSYKVSDYMTLTSGLDIWRKGMVSGILGRSENRDNFFLRIQLAL